MTKLICGWCRGSIDMKIKIGPHGDRNILICPNCGRLLPSSKKEEIQGPGRKHIHVDWKDGDIVI